MIKDKDTTMNAQEGRPGEDSGWERWLSLATLFFSILSSLVGILESVSRGAKSLGDISRLLPFVGAFLWLITIGFSLWILFAKKRSKIDSKRLVNRYDEESRYIAKIVLAVAIIFFILVILAFTIHLVLNHLATKKEFADLVIPENKFGIVIAEFAEGPNFEESRKGKEITQLFITNLERDLQQTSLADEVILRRWKIIRSQETAEDIGARANADLVIWGWMPIGTEDAAIPSFTLLTPAYQVVAPTPYFLKTEITGLETVQLGKILSGRATVLVACVMGFSYLHQANFDQAISQFSDAIDMAHEKEDLVTEDEFSRREFERDLSILYVFRGLAYDLRGDGMIAAEKDFQIAMELDPISPIPYVASGNLHYSRGEWAEAERRYLLAINTSPTNAASHYSLGNAYFSQGKIHEAASEYEKAVVLQSKFALAYFNLGSARESLEDCPRARAAFYKVREIAPNDPISVQAVKKAEQCGQAISMFTTPFPTPTPLPTVSPMMTKYYWSTSLLFILLVPGGLVGGISLRLLYQALLRRHPRN